MRLLLVLIFSMPVYADRLALVIGNGDYLYESSLNAPVNDAKDMAEILRSLGFKVIVKYNLRQRNFDSAVQVGSVQCNETDHIGINLRKILSYLVKYYQYLE
ncbi:MAG: caspase family protein [Candidatus Marithrix sp.]